MNNCKYQIGQVVQIGTYEGEGRTLVVREARVVNTVSRLHGNNSWVWLSVAHDDCFEDMRVSTRALTRLIRNAETTNA